MNAQLQEKEVNQVVEYGVTDAALAQLKEKFNKVPDASTKEGYELIKAGLKEISPLRIGIEKKRVKLKAESLAWGKKVDAEAKRITSEIVALEEPYKEAKKFQDDKEEREKQEAIEQEAAQKQKERDKQIAKEAEERATKAAELKAQEEREAAEERERELKAQAEKAEREARETEQRLKDEAEAKIKQEAAEAEAREKNRKHKAAINNAAIDALVEGGMTKTNAKQAVTLIAKRLIPNVVISY